MDIPVLYENGALCAINKPVGIVVNRSETTHHETIQDWAEAKISLQRSSGQANLKSPFNETQDKQISNNDQEFLARSGIVHRLDKETSGVLLIAKTPEAFNALKHQFMERTVEKVYRALVHGTLPPEGEIRVPIARLPWNRMRFGVVPGGREAISRFRTLSTHTLLPGNDTVTYVEIYPTTGRTHQIRVHFAYLKHPVVGDELYAGRKVSANDRRIVPRLMLHAFRLSVDHPESGTRLVFEAPIPDDMKRILAG